jgi:hypothetical protein
MSDNNTTMVCVSSPSKFLDDDITESTADQMLLSIFSDCLFQELGPSVMVPPVTCHR